MKRIRSATAPDTSATVTIAKPAWKATKASAGTVPTSGISTAPPPAPKLPPINEVRPANCVGSPIHPPTLSSPNTIEYPNRTHRTHTTPMADRLIIIMFSTLFTRTMPP
jgi:hypothetical protein